MKVIFEKYESAGGSEETGIKSLTSCCTGMVEAFNKEIIFNQGGNIVIRTLYTGETKPIKFCPWCGDAFQFSTE